MANGNDTNNEGKAQHYLPQFYLKGFAMKGSLWVFEKGKPPRESTPKSEAHRPDYYTHSENGQRDETAETFLATIESRGAPVIRKLANPHYKLIPENVQDIYLFVAFMFVRVPSWREHLDKLAVATAKTLNKKVAQDKERFYDLYNRVQQETGKSVADPEKLRHQMLKAQYDGYEIVQGSKAFNIESMLKSGWSVFDKCKEFGYQVLYAPAGKFFFASDSPVFTLLPDPKTKEATLGTGFGWPGVEVYFPLNKRACLQLKSGLSGYSVNVSERRVDYINRITMMFATQHLYSCQGFRRTARLFDERGCKILPGRDAFLTREFGRL
jgi:hypothetical protein